MKKLILISFLLAGLSRCVPWLSAADATPEALKSKAYELYEQKRFAESAEAFQSYLDKSPDDLPAALDLASLLSQLNRHAEAAKMLESYHQKSPQNEAAWFKLGVEYVSLKRPADAEKIFAALGNSANRDMAAAATEALRRLRADVAREERLKAEQNVFALAEQFQHRALVDAVADLEKTGPLSFAMEMQRLHALTSLHEYAPALERADRLASSYPDATDLTLVRADLLAQLGRRPEAVAIWRRVERENAGSAAAATAAERLRAATIWDEEEKVYALARQARHGEVIAAVDELEKKGPLSFAIEMQRLHAWQNLGQTKPALKRANDLAARFPAMSELGLFRADLLARQGQWTQAENILRQISRNNAGTPAAFEADQRLRAETARREQNSVEEKIFALAREQKNGAVVAAIDDLEKRGKLPWIFELQRLYSWQALGENARALQKAEELSARDPGAMDVALIRASLLAQGGRKEDAATLLKEIEQRNPGSPVAAEASKQMAALTAPPVSPTAESRIYEMANKQQYRDVVAAIDELEHQGALSLPMAMQRLYALQALGNKPRVAEEAAKLAAANPKSTDLALLRSDLLIAEHKWEEASKILKQIKQDNPDTPAGGEAERRLQSIPPVANLDKWYWGEAYLSGDYLGRFGTVVGSGFIRHGYFIPGARWLQPYGEMRFTADTRSGVGFQRSIVADNYLGLSLGVRAQPFPTEYLFAYASGGLNKDLLDRRHGGAWASDYQAGIYGFKSWGPGTILQSALPGGDIPTTGTIPPVSVAAASNAPQINPNRSFWRGDWFADAGADFSYYHRYASWIGYGQAHEGFRLFQIGPRAAVDAYAVENLSWDIRGNYFDNLIEIGPGARCLWVPHRGWEVILRTEYLNGFYFGRDDRMTRQGVAGHYDDFRVGLSVGARW